MRLDVQCARDWVSTAYWCSLRGLMVMRQKMKTSTYHAGGKCEGQAKSRRSLAKRALRIGGVLVAMAAVLPGCGGGSTAGTADTDTQTTLTGVFLDAAVAGINYRTDSQEPAVTNEKGEFKYIAGDVITFSIGDIDLPSAPAGSVMTPLTLVGTTDVADTQVVNIVRLLVSLDGDGDPTNGIAIGAGAHEAASGMNVDFASPTFETDVADLMLALSTELVTTEEAIVHLQETLATSVPVPDLMAGTWWSVEHDDGLRADGTTDYHCEEVAGLNAIAVGSDGSWTYSFWDAVDGPQSVTFPAAAVSTDEEAKTAILMDADGQGRMVLAYDTAANAIEGEWQPLFNDAWLDGYETWTSTPPAVATMLAGTWWSIQHNDGLRQDGSYDAFAEEVDGQETISVGGDGSWSYSYIDPIDGEQTLTYPPAAVTIDSETYQVFLLDDDGQGRIVLRYDANINGIRGQWQKLADDGITWWDNYETWTSYPISACDGEPIIIPGDTSIIGAWSTTLNDHNVVFTFFADGSYVHAESGPTDPDGQSGMERGTYSLNLVNGAFASACPSVDTNGYWGLSHPNPDLGCTGSTATVSVSSSSLAFYSADGDITLTRASDAANPIVGSWSANLDGNNVVFTFLAGGTYVHAEDGPNHCELCMDGIEMGPYSWNAGTGAFATTCPTVDTNGEAGLSHPDPEAGCTGVTASVMVAGDVLTFDFGSDGTLAFARVTP